MGGVYFQKEKIGRKAEKKKGKEILDDFLRLVGREENEN